jgi:hypothetical protein
MPVQHLSTVERLRSLAARDAKEIARLRAALAFARSAIKSGEPWGPVCERIIGGALSGRTADEAEEP